MARVLLVFGTLLVWITSAHAQRIVPTDTTRARAVNAAPMTHQRSVLRRRTTRNPGAPPVITNYSPGYGPPGTTLTISGTGFGLPATSSSVTVLSAVTNTWIKWTLTSWSDSEIVVTVPSNMPIGKVYLRVTANGLQSSETSPFTVGVPPSITSYSPTSGSPGTALTINGKGFGGVTATNVLYVLSAVTNFWTKWNTTSWSDSEIVAIVPSNMPLGKVSLIVTADGLQSIGTYPFTVGGPPSITSYSPSSGSAGTVLTINGKGFGAQAAGSSLNIVSAVTGARTTWTPTSWSDSQIVVSVPATTASGKCYLSVTEDELESLGTYPFTVGKPPVIIGFSPEFGPPGTVLTINGSGFGSSAASGSLTVNSADTGAWTTWTPTSWSDNKIVATVPSNVPSGKVYLFVTANKLTDVGTYPFYVGIPPAITSYSPQFGPPGTVITISGTGFGSPDEDSYLYVLSAVDNSVKWWKTDSWNDTQIVVTVPATASLGKVYLVAEVGELETLGWHAFTIGTPPSITSYSPAAGPAGTVLTINGTDFGSQQDDSYVSVQTAGSDIFTIWKPTSWSANQIVVPVPGTMPPGKVYFYVTVNKLQSITSNPFTVGTPPEIDNYSPGFGLPGTLVTITGKGFGAPLASSSLNVVSSVTGNRTTWTPISWNDTEIVSAVPSGMPLGKVYFSVTVNQLESIGTYPFTVGVPPSIGSYSPGSGAPGTVLTIKGTGFGLPGPDSYVSVLSAVTNTWTVWPTTSWTDSQIVVPVPIDMPVGKVYLGVIANQLRSLETSPFTVGIPPSITSYSPQLGPVGTVLTINGAGFGSIQTNSTFYVNFPATAAWIHWTPTSWSDTQLLIPVPQSSPAGRYYLFMVVNGLWTIGTYPFDVH
jgi:hypothetical protein